MGSQGAALCTLTPCGNRITAHYLPAVPANIVNTSGAGDCLVGGALARLVQGASPLQAIATGVVRSARSLPVDSAVACHAVFSIPHMVANVLSDLHVARTL